MASARGQQPREAQPGSRSTPDLQGLTLAVARVLALVASLFFAVLVISERFPVQPVGPGLERDAHYAFMGLGLVSAAIAWRWPLAGGALLTLLGATLGIATAAWSSSDVAIAGVLIFLLPGVLLLAGWSLGRGRVAALVTAGLVVTVLALAGAQARAQHLAEFGPAHPQSPLEGRPVDSVEWVWSGGVTQTTARVKAKLTEDSAAARLVVSATESFTAPRIIQGSVEDGVASFDISSLIAGRRYFYAVEVDGRVDWLRRGSFRTFPAERQSFSVLVSACARTGSNGAVFDTMRSEQASLYILTGDAHYEDITLGGVGRFGDAYHRMLTAPAQAALYEAMPIAYVWDDHDFGGNNSSALSPVREAARLAYRRYVPHYGLPAGEGDAAIYQAFSLASVRFILLDTRSMRDAEQLPGGGDSLLGAEQREWLKRELAQGASVHDLVVVVSPVPWIAPDDGSRDDWGGYARERRDIAEFIAGNGIDNLLMLSGDAHMLAIDDGSNSDYSATGGADFPVFQAAALDRPGSVKGGPYSEGAYPGGGQYGNVTFTYEGSNLRVALSGRNWLGEEIVGLEFIVAVAP